MNSKKLFIYHLITKFIPATRCFYLKSILLRWCGAKIGENVRIASSATFLTTGELTIGNNTWIGHDVLVLGGTAPIIIGANCDIAPRVALISGTHKINSMPNEQVAGPGYSLPIKIEDGCWLCANALVLGGAKISKRTIVAPNSVVKNQYQKDGVLIGGTPAKIIKVLE